MGQWMTVISVTAVVFAVWMAILYAGLTLIRNYVSVGRVLGILVVMLWGAGLIPILRPLGRNWRKTREFPQLRAALTAYRHTDHAFPVITHVRIEEQSFRLQLVPSRFGLRLGLRIGRPLLYLLDADTFAAGLWRETGSLRTGERMGLRVVQWARGVLLQTGESMAAEGRQWASSTPVATSGQTVGSMGAARNGSQLVAAARLVLLPVSVLLTVMYALMARSLEDLEQWVIYRGNAFAARNTSTDIVRRYLETLCLRDSLQLVLERASDHGLTPAAVIDKVVSLPQRERDRLRYNAEEEVPNRPRLAWQLTMLATAAGREHAREDIQDWAAIRAELSSN